ncbi:cutinase family protein [Antrihabitans spumae]|uniref:Cutinase family protein n=1 Tax=Antrihabitans spumae TaxID=3373370 RepID=A0ABW7JZE8_9NOCA
MRSKIIAALLGAVVAASGVVVGGVVGGAVAQADPACPSLYVVAIPGTWETTTGRVPGPGMLSDATDGLPSNVQVDYVSYAATAFPWESEVYGRSKKQATDNGRGFIQAMAQRCGNTRIALLGYSQGADAAGDLAAEIGSGLGVVPPTKLAAVGLISDPRRSESDALVGPFVPGSGAGGPRIGGFGLASSQTRTICAVGDLYCSTPKDDFVTRFAGFLAQSSDPSPAQFSRYTQEALAIFNDLMLSGGIPLLQSQLSDPANEKRAEQLEQFYRSQVHTDYRNYSVDGSGTSATRWMRNWLRDAA